MREKALIIILAILITIIPQFIAAIDAPHNEGNNVYCGSCHGQSLLNSPFWGGNTSYDDICLSCHKAAVGPYSDINAPLSKTHSSATTSNKYGEWSKECRDCHDPHYQKQKNYKNTDPNNLYLATGTIQSCTDNGDGTSTSTYSIITYKPGWDAAKLVKKTMLHRGTILFPNVNKLGYDYSITAVDPMEKTITVKGNACTYLYPPSTFAVMYGQYIKDVIDTGTECDTVKFFDNQGKNSFADGDGTDGICVVCHTKTTHYRCGGGAPDQNHGDFGGEDGTDCTSSCHTHKGGLRGESAGGVECQECHSDIWDYMNSETDYHHYMNNAGTSYAIITQPVNMGNTTDTNRNCFMCHVDHDIFRPDINLNGTRGANLRSSISVSPSAGDTNSYVNTDFISTQAQGGICISCHATAQSKSYTQPDNTTKTPAIDKADFTISAHNYAAPATYKRDNSSFNANCSKCHNDTLNPKSSFDAQSSTSKFGNHQSTLRTVSAPLDISSPADPLEENFCYRCHSKTTDINPGGGQAKLTINNDYYGVANMTDASENIFSVFGKLYNHNVGGYSGKHKPSSVDETRAYLSANKHVECNDCHNPHTARAGLHSSSKVHVAAHSNLISDSGPLTGALGVQPTWSPTNQYGNWGFAQSWPSTTSTATKECQICFKCHSSYNTNLSSWGGSGTQSWTDVTLEFHPSNSSYHPVVQALPLLDPGYIYDPDWNEWTDYQFGSNQLPPAFTSLVIGDSGKATTITGTRITDTTKNWTAGKWVNWGLRIGALAYAYTADVSKYNYVRRITANDSNYLDATPSIFGGISQTPDTVYSIEYYAGRGNKSGTTITDTYKDFNLYLPSLIGYVVVITDDSGNNIAKGTVTSNTSTSFTVDAWTFLYGSTLGNVEVGYYFSATGHAMMCSDCHGNDSISPTAAQGPHGSAVKWMLKGRNRAWPAISASNNGTGTGTLFTIGRTASIATHRSVNDGTADGLFCLNCHSTVSFTKNATGREYPGSSVTHSGNPHSIHSWDDGPACVNCHVLVPHGSKISRLIGDGDGAMPSRYAFNNDPTNMYITSFKKAFDASGYSDPGAYIADNCASNNTTGCHRHDSSSYGWENW